MINLRGTFEEEKKNFNEYFINLALHIGSISFSINIINYRLS